MMAIEKKINQFMRHAKRKNKIGNMRMFKGK
jgi:hypothetical protein